MRIRLTAALLSATVLAATAARAMPVEHVPVVKTDSGRLVGRESAGVTSFRGIPYAAPPVGALRWAPPSPAPLWPGLREARSFGALCMQKIVKDNGVGPGPASEDCLTLNVIAPVRARRLPVMVWIHGGGLVNGSATAALYDGSALARQGVVVVTLNYRLGRFGFFAHPALTAEAGGRADLANYGLMDQVAALKWVKRNIAAFGGNPAHVTIFGESAGGMSVNRLMMMDEARGLFVRAISESGVGRERGRTLAQAEVDGEAFAASLGVKGQDAAALRALPAAAIVAAGDPDVQRGDLPILDGRLLKENPDEAFHAGHVAKVPYLVGSNSLEFPPAFLGPRLAAMTGDLGPARKAAALAAYGSRGAFEDHVASDILFGEPARALARDQARAGAPVWLYRFSVLSAEAPKMLKGAPHASDRQYVFRTLAASPWPTDDRDAALAETISAYFVAFAKTGNPNGPGRPKWPRYDAASDRLMNFTNDGPAAMATPDAAALDALAPTPATP